MCATFCGICAAIMRFMGDSPLRGVTEQEVISTFLKVKHSQVVHFQPCSGASSVFDCCSFLDFQARSDHENNHTAEQEMCVLETIHCFGDFF